VHSLAPGERGGAACSLSLSQVLTTASLLHHQQGLLRAVGMFLTGIIVARNFGDAFNV